jgi:signal peptidase
MSLSFRITRLARRAVDVLLIVLILGVLATLAIARVIPAATGGATFVVGGGSMEPTIPLGSVAFAMPVARGELAVGDVVSIQVGEDRAIFTHRIIRLIEREDGRWLETKGDANQDPDPSIISATAVIGRVEATIPYAGYAVRLLGTAQGVALAIALATLLVAGAWLLESLEHDHARFRSRATRESVPG